MTKSMARWTVVGCMALAALSAAALLDVGSVTAEAAPSASPFAGNYVGPDPAGWVPNWAVAVSDGGRITGVRSGFSRDKIGGQVDADGAYSLSVTATIWVFVRSHGHTSSDPELELRTVSYKTTGTMAFDAAGDVVGDDVHGGGFVWAAQ